MLLDTPSTTPVVETQDKKYSITPQPSYANQGATMGQPSFDIGTMECSSVSSQCFNHYALPLHSPSLPVSPYLKQEQVYPSKPSCGFDLSAENPRHPLYIASAPIVKSQASEFSYSTQFSTLQDKSLAADYFTSYTMMDGVTEDVNSVEPLSNPQPQGQCEKSSSMALYGPEFMQFEKEIPSDIYYPLGLDSFSSFEPQASVNKDFYRPSVLVTIPLLPSSSIPNVLPQSSPHRSSNRNPPVELQAQTIHNSTSMNPVSTYELDCLNVCPPMFSQRVAIESYKPETQTPSLPYYLPYQHTLVVPSHKDNNDMSKDHSIKVESSYPCGQEIPAPEHALPSEKSETPSSGQDKDEERHHLNAMPLINSPLSVEMETSSHAQLPESVVVFEQEKVDRQAGQDTIEKEQNCQWNGCSFEFNHLEALVSHIKYDHIQSGKTLYFCGWRNCSRNQKAFTKRHKMHNHLRTHTGERPFLCTKPECGKKFSRPDSLATHTKIHSSIRPYLCNFEECGKAYYHIRSLRKHERGHMNAECQKPFFQ